MSTPANTSAVGEINRLHAEVVRLSKASEESIHAALVAAWRSGKLLIAEKDRVKHSMGCCMWRVWLEQNFQGTQRTAQKYMRLAETVSDFAQLDGEFRRVLIHIHADAEDDVPHAIHFRAHLSKNAHDFFSADQKIVRPLDVRREPGDRFDGAAQRRGRGDRQLRRFLRT